MKLMLEESTNDPISHPMSKINQENPSPLRYKISHSNKFTHIFSLDTIGLQYANGNTLSNNPCLNVGSTEIEIKLTKIKIDNYPEKLRDRYCKKQIKLSILQFSLKFSLILRLVLPIQFIFISSNWFAFLVRLVRLC